MNNQHKLTFAEEVTIVNRQLETAKEWHFTIEEKQVWRDQMGKILNPILEKSHREKIYTAYNSPFYAR